MATISVSLPNDGDTIDAADYNTPITTIVNTINGNLDNDNIKSAAGISGSKLADASLDLGAKASTWDGWIAVSDSWAYASATTVTVPTDATTKYSVGDKVKFTNTTLKYFTITAVAATTLTLLGQGGVTVANAAISGISYSHVQTPVGNSDAWQSWTPTLTNLSGGTLNYSKYIQIGKTVYFRLKYTLAGAGVAGGVSFTPPVTAEATWTGETPVGEAYLVDTGVNNYSGTVYAASTTSFVIRPRVASGTYLTQSSALSSTVPFTWGNTDIIELTGFYEAA